MIVHSLPEFTAKTARDGPRVQSEPPMWLLHSRPANDAEMTLDLLPDDCLRVVVNCLDLSTLLAVVPSCKVLRRHIRALTRELHRDSLGQWTRLVARFPTCSPTLRIIVVGDSCVGKTATPSAPTGAGSVALAPSSSSVDASRAICSGWKSIAGGQSAWSASTTDGPPAGARCSGAADVATSQRR